MRASTAARRASDTRPLQLVTTDQMLSRMREYVDNIARRAFEIFESNGRRLGRDLDDWLRAEAELLHPLHVEVSETDDALTVAAEVPGFDEKDIKVSIEPRRLTISGKRETTEERKKGKTIYSERCSDEIFRAMNLPVEVDAASSAVKAQYDRGMLTITLPKAAKATGREIKLSSSGGSLS